ncbi:MAG: VCBS repeat-containing protein [Planctomycetes bacterium]|nr:VCBS repeat-containing protein [Planctomycetota bacterium]
MRRASLLVALTFVSAAPIAAQQVLFQGFGSQPNGGTGSKLAGGGDLDGDGVGDLLVASPTASGGRVHAVSGANGTVRTLSHPTNDAVFAIVPDANLDGRADILLSLNGQLRLYSGATLTLLWQSVNQYQPACGIDDRNGDGRADIAAITSNSPYELRVLSGSNGTILAQYPYGTSSGELTSIGDVTGDGIPELAHANSSVSVLRLSPSPVLLASFAPGIRVGAANFTGDARNEVVSSDNNGVRILSATTGATVRSFANVTSSEFAILGDVNADGVPDLALLRMYLPYTTGYTVEIVSGANGSVLARKPPSAQSLQLHITALGDVNNDGFGDFAVGDPNGDLAGNNTSPTGSWQIVSGKVLAFREEKPVNCAFGPFLPELGMTLPRLGTNVVVAGQDAPPGAVGLVAFSLQPPVGINLGITGCDAWFDLASGSLLQTTTTAAWQFAFPMPAAPQLAGVGIALQAVYAPSLHPLGFDLSNGLWGRIGW